MSFSQREARALVRKAVARVPEGESIRHLNIMPMMDMMTILLVAFIFQMATSALELTAGTVQLFFGYVESYTIAWTLAFVSLVTGLRMARDVGLGIVDRLPRLKEWFVGTGRARHLLAREPGRRIPRKPAGSA